MINVDLGNAISKYVAKSFDHMYDSRKAKGCITIQRIFADCWKEFLSLDLIKKIGIRPVVLKEVAKMLICGTLEAGFDIYECPHCHKNHIICHRCHSRFCTSCGIKYARARAANISKSTLDVNHRHVVFTIDERLRIYFRQDYKRLNLLFKSVEETINYTFTKMVSKKDTFMPGYIMTLHTFGRDLKWNPHIHLLLTEGGMNKDGHYKTINYINYETLRKSFMYRITTNLRELFPKGSKERSEFNALVREIYKDYQDGFYVYAPPMKKKKKDESDVVSYIVRYTGRPVMAQSRITAYDYENRTIDYYYEDHKTGERVDVHESVFKFIGKLIIHIPEEQFKMVRYYGIYSTCEHRHKRAMRIKRMKKEKTKDAPRFYREQLLSSFDTDPLLCSCGHIMEYVDSYIPPGARK